MHHMNRNPWFRSALFHVWQKMMKDAKRMMRAGLHLNSEDGFPVEPLLRDFDRFVLWARVCKGYERGKMDNYRLERYRLNEGFIPENLFFTKQPPADVMAEEATITRGASGVIYKDGKFAPKWNGQSKTRLYNIWKTTCRACSDPGQKDYARLGGKGIRVQEEWRKDYLAFEDWAWEHGYTDEMSLVRIDKEKDFTPKNCRWETATERQCSNLRCYEKIRLSVKRMREYLEKIDDLAICTLIIAPRHAMPIDGEQDDLEPTPVEYRIDKVRP